MIYIPIKLEISLIVAQFQVGQFWQAWKGIFFKILDLIVTQITEELVYKTMAKKTFMILTADSDEPGLL